MRTQAFLFAFKSGYGWFKSSTISISKLCDIVVSERSNPASRENGIGTLLTIRSGSIAAPNSERTNLSPFTKGCREEGASLRISEFFLGSAHTDLSQVCGTRNHRVVCFGIINGARVKCSTAYLLGLLAMIKCSICSYQYDN